jgi:NitT/TauT family transport system ATP-binding protein
MINVVNISKYYEGICIFKDLSFDINRGEVLGIWGPNGSGKSTILKIVAGIIDYEREGTIKKKNGEVRISYMPQDPMKLLLPWYSSQKNIMFLASHQGPVKRVSELLGSIGFVKEDIHKKPPKLSGGNQRKLAFLCALSRSFDCLLLDEPYVGMDMASMEFTADEIRRIASQGKAVVVVTHDPEILILCSDRILILNKDESGKSVIADDIKISLESRAIKVLSSEVIHKYQDHIIRKSYGI